MLSELGEVAAVQRDLSRTWQWVRRRGLLVAATAVAGMLVGAVVYFVLRMTGVGFYVVTGGVAALLGAATWRWFTRSTAISEVEVTVPQLSKIKFAVTKDHRVMARRILVQMSSRVAVRPLEDGLGRADEAIQSLFTLFTIVRDLLDEDATTRLTPGRPKVDILAMNMLNRHLSPFLSKWHRIYDDWRTANKDISESEWPDDAKFRTELRHLQSELRTCAAGFAKMADYQDYAEIIGLFEE